MLTLKAAIYWGHCQWNSSLYVWEQSGTRSIGGVRMEYLCLERRICKNTNYFGFRVCCPPRTRILKLLSTASLYSILTANIFFFSLKNIYLSNIVIESNLIQIKPKFLPIHWHKKALNLNKLAVGMMGKPTEPKGMQQIKIFPIHEKVWSQK